MVSKHLAPFDSTKALAVWGANINLTVFQCSFLSFLVRNVSRSCDMYVFCRCLNSFLAFFPSTLRHTRVCKPKIVASNF